MAAWVTPVASRSLASCTFMMASSSSPSATNHPVRSAGIKIFDRLDTKTTRPSVSKLLMAGSGAWSYPKSRYGESSKMMKL